MIGIRMVVTTVAGLALVATSAVPAVAATAAPGAPGVDEQFLPADKSGFGTSTTLGSKVWLTVQKEGGLGELYYPDLSTPSARTLDFVVADGRGHAVRAKAARTVQTDPRSLSYRQVFDGHGWRLTADYTTDPARASVLVDVRFTASRSHALYAVYDPALSNSRGDDTGRTVDRTLVASDATSASAFAADPPFTATSNGFRGTSDGWTDLLADGRLDGRYDEAGAGNLVQTANTGLTGSHGRQHATLAISFGGNPSAAGATADASLRAGYGRAAAAYARGWHDYLRAGKRTPDSLRGRDQRTLYDVSVMVLAASEDKTHRGAYVASPSMPWIWGKDDPSGPYHLVWSRDLYQIATALIAAGDTAGANRSLDYLFDVQQKPDGSFPQNSRVDGTPVWTGLQLDEVALPIVLAHQLGRTDRWSQVKKAADFLLSFEQDGNRAPWSPQDRWENQSGYSPATIAAEIAGLVCAADMAKANGDSASAARYLATADDWQARVKSWTVTTTGPYSAGPYFLRLTKDGNPNAGTTYTIGDSGPADVDQRRVVDPSFLDLVRLGVLPPDDPAVVNTLGVIDAQLKTGRYYHRASFDGYGEKVDGSQWEFGLPDGSRITRGRAWPLLNGERGEYQIAAGQVGAARRQIDAMADAAGPGAMLPEQVWDDQPPAGTAGFKPGTPTFSATPLAWTHAGYLRLAANVAAGRVLEQPAIVAERYASPAQTVRR
ncbi:glycoside hydrolase family 15 protein [Asanoa sp. NPDC050611]|uniref:glycoside hydrolase family 15 protein n=1 Tax=Asanoa sp. NPDC050611 TaxID=3157098 RepID=UPI0033F1E28D